LTEFASLDINQTIGLVIGVSTIIGITITGIRWYYKRAYSDGVNDITDEHIHKSLSSKIEDLDSKIRKDKKEILDEMGMVETRLGNKVDDRVHQRDLGILEFKKEFEQHVSDDTKNFAETHDRIDVVHSRIDKVSGDTSYIRGQIDTFLKKSKQ